MRGTRELLGDAGASRRHHAEDLDHADDRAEKTQQRRTRDDRSERRQPALQRRELEASGVLEDLLELFVRRISVLDQRGHEIGKGPRMAMAVVDRALELVAREQTRQRLDRRALEKVAAPQHPQPLHDDGNRHQ
jgi:hypothetical protein